MANFSTRRSARPLADDQQGLTDIVGQFLLIGISVGMVATLSFFIASQPAPNDPLSADLTVADSGGNLTLEHKWGESLRLEDGRLIVEVNDGFQEFSLDDEAILDNSDLDEGDETLWEIGERLCVACLYGDGDIIRQVGVAGGPAGRQELVTSWRGEAEVGSVDLLPLADFDYDPDPVVAGEEVTFTDQSTDPDGGQLQNWTWEFGDGTRSFQENPPPHTYEDPDTYQVNLTVTDDEGDTDDATEPITVYDRTAFLACPFSSVQKGSVSNCTNAQNNDRDPPAILDEESPTSSETVVLNATAVVDGPWSGGWTNRTDALDSNDTYAKTSQHNKEIRFEIQNETRNLPETITSVVLHAEVRLEGGDDDTFLLKACFPGGSCGKESEPMQGSNTTDKVLEYDVTSSSTHPTGSSWTWTNVNDLRVNLKTDKNKAGADQWLVDHVWAEVTYQNESTNELHATAKIPDIIEDSSEYSLEVAYCVDDIDFEFEKFEVAVKNYNNSTWDTQPEKLTERCSDGINSIPRWSVPLSSDHLNCNSGLCVAKVRFMDDEGPDPDPSRLKLGYVRVVTTA